MYNFSISYKEIFMVWPYIFCALVLGWGIYWSFPHDK